jgi:hypothetical protein
MRAPDNDLLIVLLFREVMYHGSLTIFDVVCLNLIYGDDVLHVVAVQIGDEVMYLWLL